MARTFTTRPAVSVAELLETAPDYGVAIDGDEKEGVFEGRGFAGEYKVRRGTVTLTIKKKPFLVPWSLVESGIKQYSK